MSTKHLIHIIPNYSEFTQKFAERLTPPYALEDADTDARVSVLNSIRMGYFNGDQLPIPAGTSAEAGVAHLLRQVATECAVATITAAEPFVGSEPLTASVITTTAAVKSPSVLLEQDNDFHVGLYALKIEELQRYVSSATIEVIVRDHLKSGAAVLAISEEVADSESVLAQEYRIYEESLRSA